MAELFGLNVEAGGNSKKELAAETFESYYGSESKCDSVLRLRGHRRTEFRPM